MKLLLLACTLLMSFNSRADLMRVAHRPLAMVNKTGNFISYEGESINYTEWKMTDKVPNNSLYASGVVIGVKSGIEFTNNTSSPSVTFLYDKSIRYKAVYILTDAHVWYNDRSELQTGSARLNPDPNRYTMMVGTELFLYGNSGKETFKNLYFPETSPVNSWNGKKYNFNLTNMGVKELTYCWQPKVHQEAVGNLNLNWGCDFVLIRILVPDYIDVKAEKIAKRMPNKETELKVWYGSNQSSQYKVKKYYGKNNEVFLADLAGRGYSAIPGWSGSPIYNNETQEVVGLVASGWEGRSTMMGAYSMTYIMENLGVLAAMEADYNSLKQSVIAAPYAGNFYEMYDHELQGN